ncbi:MAG: chemotaxis protein CheW [Desulfobacterales bacterium]|nr:chemotaxis protein CheW [Desulfobacterales bacterium]
MAASEKKNAGVYLAFNLEDETFAFEMTHVREVLEPRDFSRVPHFPHFMRGAINVRGSVEIVADIRGVLGMPRVEITDRSRIIMIETMVAGEPITRGALVDSVRSVIKIRQDLIEPPPETGRQWRAELIKGIGRKDDRFILILDVDQMHVFIESSL